jgi:protease I
MANELTGMRVAFLATDGVEQVELTEPWNALRAAGAKPHLVSIKHGEIRAVHHMDKGDAFPVDRLVDDVTADDYDALVIPGGVANPDALRMHRRAVKFVRDFMALDRPVAAICHGPWMLVEADVVRGRTLTSWPSLQTDIRNAGGTWVDHPVQADQRLVTSRKPADIPAFNKALLTVFSDALQVRKVDRQSEQSFPASDPPSWGGSTI